MKKIIGALGLLAVTIALHIALSPFDTYRGMAQVSNPSIVAVPSAPSGSCSWTFPLKLKTPDGTLYSCQNGTVGQIGGSSGGDTITSPNSTLTVGGTSSATTLDLNLAHSNSWTALQTFNAGIAGGLSGTNVTPLNLATGNQNEFLLTGTDYASAYAGLISYYGSPAFVAQTNSTGQIAGYAAGGTYATPTSAHVIIGVPFSAGVG